MVYVGTDRHMAALAEIRIYTTVLGKNCTLVSLYTTVQYQMHLMVPARFEHKSSEGAAAAGSSSHPQE